MLYSDAHLFRHYHSLVSGQVPMALAMVGLRSTHPHFLHTCWSSKWPSYYALFRYLGNVICLESTLLDRIDIMASLRGLLSLVLSGHLAHLPVPVQLCRKLDAQHPASLNQATPVCPR